MAALVRVGWPVGFILLFEVGLFTTGTFMMGWVGTTALAASALAGQLTHVTFMVPLGIGQAARAGAGAGAGGRDAADRFARDRRLAGRDHAERRAPDPGRRPGAARGPGRGAAPAASS